MHLQRDASSQILQRDDWGGLRWRQRILNKSTRKPNKELGTSDLVFIVFCDNITSLVCTKTAVAIQKKLVPFRVATAINRGFSTT